MRFVEFYTEDEGNETPDNLVPYKSRVEGSQIPLGPYTNDWLPDPGFKDVDILLRQIDKQIEAGNIRTELVPTRKLLATQTWLNQDEAGAGDPVIDQLEDYPVLALLSDGYYHIIDGHHRSNAAVDAGKPYMKAYVFKL